MLKSKVESYYTQHNRNRICQGDILKDLILHEYVPCSANNSELSIKEISLPYSIIISQDCDLAQSYNPPKEDTTQHQYIHNIILLPIFSSTSIKSGDHCKDLFDILYNKISTSTIQNIQQNSIDRYHCLPQWSEIFSEPMIIDFKIYFTITKMQLLIDYNNKYYCTYNEIFRERLSQRFCNYLNRIGMPEIEPK